jgi:hypothetical protein
VPPGAVAIVAGAALLLASWRAPQRRAWAVLTIAAALLYLGLRELPRLAASAPAAGWNWSGHLLALAGMIALGGLLAGRAGLTAADLGLARPAALRQALVVCVAALLAGVVAHSLWGGRSANIPASTWLFVATMPGLAEEVAFRGVLLAAAERAAPAARRVAGVPVSVGAALLTVAFVGLHGLGAGLLVSVLPGALLYLWLRLKTGSVVVPIVAHNLWNLTVLATHFDPNA